MKKLFAILGFIAGIPTLAIFITTMQAPHASALLNFSDHLMDDSIFLAPDAMNAPQGASTSYSVIQTFLQNEGSGLANYSDIEDCGPTSGQYYTFNATYYSCGQTVPAAKIIYDAAHAYGINPQIILATLQKEQSLITTPNPTASQLSYAMGYGCPDSGGCSHPGFFNQVDWATWQFRADYEWGSGRSYFGYAASSYPCSGATRYYDKGLIAGNTVTFKDDNGTAYAILTLPNMSTASFYCYTPHVYNNPSGLYSLPKFGTTGMYYSGSYNFAYYYNLWFVPYAWQPQQQSAYTDSTMATPVDTLNLLPGQRFYVVIKALNAGSSTWQTGVYGQQVNAATSRPIDRKSAFCDSSWLGTNCNRPGTTAESSVAPGGTGTFGFWMTAPGWAGTYYEYFNLVADGTTWLNDPGLYWTMQVKQPSWQPVQQSAYTDSTMATPVDTLKLGPGQKYYLLIKAKNTGTTPWQKGVSGRQVNVGTSRPTDRKSAFCDSGWLGTDCNRPATTSETSVAPGATGTFGFWINTPAKTGTYYEFFNLVMDGTSWLNDPGLYWTMTVNPVQPSWQPVQQSAYTDSTMATPVDTLSLAPGQRFYLFIKAKNTGNVVWQKGVSGRQVNVGTSRPTDRQSQFCDSSWLNTFCNRPATTTEDTVQFGQTGSFGFWATAPTKTGTYYEYFNLVMDGTSWLNDPGLYWTMTVK